MESILEEYKKNGFLVLENFFSPSEINALREACCDKKILDYLNEDHGKSGFHRLEIVPLHPTFKNFAKHKKLVSILQILLGNEIRLQHSKIAIKPPSQTKGLVHWHQDFVYFPHTNLSLVAVMIALDDMTKENGALQVIPGSHKGGEQKHVQSEDVVDGQCDPQYVKSNISRLKTLTMKAGGISLHHCLLLHGSDYNKSPFPRRAIVFEYRSVHAIPIGGRKWKDSNLLISSEKTLA